MIDIIFSLLKSQWLTVISTHAEFATRSLSHGAIVNEFHEFKHFMQL
jgi:hypothetical protein